METDAPRQPAIPTPATRTLRGRPVSAVNKIKHKGDWEVLAYWQRSEQYSLDPNLIDNDVFDAHLALNLQGVVQSARATQSDGRGDAQPHLQPW